jgi:hypothetical protein
MPDLQCSKQRNFYLIEAMSYYGQRWLERNMSMGDKNYLVVQADLFEDLLSYFRESGLEVDVHD